MGKPLRLACVFGIVLALASVMPAEAGYRGWRTHFMGFAPGVPNVYVYPYAYQTPTYYYAQPPTVYYYPPPAVVYQQAPSTYQPPPSAIPPPVSSASISAASVANQPPPAQQPGLIPLSNSDRPLSISSETLFPPLYPNSHVVKPRPAALALIIGIDKYEHEPSAEYAENDARSFYDYAANSLGVPKDRIKLLTGSAARRLDIRKALLQWGKPLTVRGQSDVFVFFAGHGLSENGKSLFLLPYDGDQSLLADSSIRRKEIIDAFAEAGAASTTLFLDTCYSGGTRAKESLMASARPIMITVNDEAVPPNVTVLNAAASDQLASSLTSTKHGLFSYFLMKGLEGDAAKSDQNGTTITADKLQAYLERHIPVEAAKLGRTQTPQLQGDGRKVLSSW